MQWSGLAIFLPMLVAALPPLDNLVDIRGEPKVVSFAAPVTIPGGGSDGAGSSEAGDFDNDGDAEFISAATSSSSDPHFRLYDWNGNGFTVRDILPPGVVAARPDRFGGDLTTADINGDGFIDIVVPASDNGAGGGSLSWFENPDGNLAQAWTERTISTWSGSGTGNVVAHMSEVDVGDINGDGLPDVVTRDINHGVFIMLQEAGDWAERIFIPTRSREGLDLFDPDGDGDLDIILNGVWLETPADPAGGTFVLHVYDDAWYAPDNNINNVRDYACQIAVRDFNGDGRDDIAISNSEELNNSAESAGKPLGIQVHLAPADPKTEAWTKVVLETEHFSWHSLEPADLNCDGAIDLVAAISTVGRDNAPAEIVAFLNNGSGTAFSKVDLVSGSVVPFVYNATLADADGDGDADLFAPDSFSNGPMRYLENTSVVDGGGLTPPANAPTALNAVAASATRIELSWTDTTTNETAFLIERRLSGGAFAQIAQVAANATAFQDTSVAPSTDYEYRVRASNQAGTSGYSTIAAARTPDAPGPNPDGLVAYWPFDEESGTTATDQVGSRVGVFGGAPTWDNAGRFDGSVAFAGLTDRVTVPSFEVGGSGLTIAAWVFPRSFDGTANEARFVSKATGTSGAQHVWMLGNYLDGSALRFRLQTSSGGTTSLVSPQGQLPLDTWSHIAGTWDGSTMKLFLNGIEIASIAKGGTIPASSADVGLGNQPLGAGDRPLDGRLDEVRIYSRALSGTELQAIAAGPGEPVPSYQAWVEQVFDAAQQQDPAVSGPTADANNDGIANLLDFAFGQDPFALDAARNPFVDGQTFVYTRRKGGLSAGPHQYRLGDLLIEVETGTDLIAANWQSSASGLIEEVTGIDAELEQVRVAAVEPLSGERRLFFRIRATLQ